MSTDNLNVRGMRTGRERSMTDHIADTGKKVEEYVDSYEGPTAVALLDADGNEVMCQVWDEPTVAGLRRVALALNRAGMVEGLRDALRNVSELRCVEDLEGGEAEDIADADLASYDKEAKPEPFRLPDDDEPTRTIAELRGLLKRFSQIYPDEVGRTEAFRCVVPGGLINEIRSAIEEAKP